VKRVTGVLLVQDPDLPGEVEVPTFTCPHCQRVGVVGKDDGGMCLKCARLLCKSEPCFKDCDPALRRLGVL
jgi:hypothetical protein